MLANVKIQIFLSDLFFFLTTKVSKFPCVLGQDCAANNGVPDLRGRQENAGENAISQRLFPPAPTAL